MPIPKYEPLQVAPNVTPGGYARADSSMFAAQQGIASAMEDAASKLHDVVKEEMRKDQDAAILERMSWYDDQVRQTFYVGDDPLFGRTGARADGMYSEAREKLAALRSEALGSASTAAERSALEKSIASLERSYLNSAAEKEYGERKQYRLDVADGAIESAILGMGGLDMLNPEQNMRDMTKLQAGIAAKEAAAGRPLTPGERMGVTSAFHTARLQASAQNDPVGSWQYFENHKHEMEPGQRASWEESTKAGIAKHYGDEVTDMYNRQGDAAAAALAEAPVQIDAPAPRTVTLTTGEEMDLSQYEGPINYNVDGRRGTSVVSRDTIAAVMAQESNGNPKAASPAGAVGLMQLMPATATALGVTDREDPHQSVMGGVEYLAYLQDRFREWGPQAELFAIAAYNAGPGGVNKAIKAAEKALGRPPMGMDEVIAHLPKETQDYVRKVGAKVANASRMSPGDIEVIQNAKMAALEKARARRAALEIPSNDPGSMDITRTAINDMTSNPEKAASMTAEQIDEAYGDKVAPAHLEQLKDVADKVRHQTNTMSEASTAAADILRRAGLEKGKAGSKDAKRWEQFQDAYWSQILYEMDNKGTALSTGEMRDIANRMLTTVYERDWFSNDEVYYFERMNEAEGGKEEFFLLDYDEIPEEEIKQIRKDFLEHPDYGREPTENEIEVAYMNMKLAYR